MISIELCAVDCVPIGYEEAASDCRCSQGSGQDCRESWTDLIRWWYVVVVFEEWDSPSGRICAIMPLISL